MFKETVIFPETYLTHRPATDDEGPYEGPGYFTISGEYDIGRELRVTIDGIAYTSIVRDGAYFGLDDVDIMFLDTTAEPYESSIFVGLIDAVSKETILFYRGYGNTTATSCTVKIETTSYSSEEYKFMLFKLLQRHFYMSRKSDRYYTRAFFGKLFEDVVVTKDAYENFVKQLNEEMEYCAANDIYACEGLSDSVINEHGLLLKDSFASIGIDLVINTENDTATFTKPDGTVMVYEVTDGTNYFYINARSGINYDYAKLSIPYYAMENVEIVPIDETHYKQAGPDCYWSYNSATSTMNISGTGTYNTRATAEEIGAGSYSTLIIGSNVSTVDVIESDKNLQTIVFLHAVEFPLNVKQFVPCGFTIDGSIYNTWNIYADNKVIRNYAFNKYVTINWHSLDEWEG